MLLMPINIKRLIHPLSSFTVFIFSHSITSKTSPPKPYPRPNLAPAMATNGDSENISAVFNDEEIVKFGFKRSEMYSSNLAGTVDSYDRHVFLCYKSHESWPSRIEDSDADLLPKRLAAALKARKTDIKIKVIIILWS